MPKPIPSVPPVMTATRPVSSSVIGCSRLAGGRGAANASVQPISITLSAIFHEPSTLRSLSR